MSSGEIWSMSMLNILVRPFKKKEKKTKKKLEISKYIYGHPQLLFYVNPDGLDSALD